MVDEKNNCPDYELNMLCSDLDVKRLLEINKVKDIAVIPNGVDTAYFKPLNQPIKPKSLIFAGGLTWYPNVDAIVFFLVDVWPLLTKKIY